MGDDRGVEMNIEHGTSNVQRRRKGRGGNRSVIVFPSCIICNALLFVVVACFSFLTTDAFCETDDTTESLRTLAPDQSRAILERLGSMRKDIRTFQADFAEERSIPSMAEPLRYEGRIYYQYDGFFFMEYKKPLHHILRVLKNEALFFVEGSSNADLVDISLVNGVAGNPNMFALDPTKLSGQVLEDNDVYILKEKKEALDKNRSGPKLTVSLEKKSLQVKKVCMEDESGDVTEIFLYNVETNLDIPKSILSFELPEGVKINRLNQP